MAQPVLYKSEGFAALRSGGEKSLPRDLLSDLQHGRMLKRWMKIPGSENDLWSFPLQTLGRD